jgi:hypothetical protein
LEVKSVRYLVSAMLLVVAVIHLIPLQGVLGSERLVSLYGPLPFEDSNLAILMRHRAVLLGALGLLLVLAAFQPAIQTVAFAAAFISVVSYMWLAWLIGGHNAQLARVFAADVVALVCLFIGAAARAYSSSWSLDIW